MTHVFSCVQCVYYLHVVNYSKFDVVNKFFEVPCVWVSPPAAGYQKPNNYLSSYWAIKLIQFAYSITSCWENQLVNFDVSSSVSPGSLFAECQFNDTRKTLIQTY